ncbi:hypothetical protein [Flavihumibacter sp. CACIAM 22H1]|uniref:hypothetical protein n=1 Tax=Flavihumibacter sp. CACIAM 22H1 TaxID=1812911 RepID=UPI000ABB8F15|nr:hypothetical protein [Flavihumibacter sp. CACIAM 22H1]
MRQLKQVILFMVSLCFTLLVQAQNPKFSPSIFTAVDQVTIEIDVTGTNMAGETAAYIWIFSNPDAADGDANKPKKDGVVNGAWGNSSESAKLTNVGANKWQFSFTGTELFGLTPAQLTSFGFLLKAKDGSKQTPDYKPFKFDPLVFTPTMMRVFPAKVGTEDVITVNFDQTLAESVNDQRLSPKEAEVTLYDNSGAVVGTKSFQLKEAGNQKWSAIFIPSYSFSVPAGTQLSRFSYLFKGTVKDATGQDIEHKTAATEIPFTQFK